MWGQQCGALHCEFYPVFAHTAPSTMVHIETINPYKLIRNKACLLKQWMDVRKWDWNNKTLHVGYYSDSKSNVCDQVVRNIYAINVVGLWITFTFPTCWLKECPQEGSQAQGGQMSELDGGWQSEWTVRHIDVERMIEIWRGEVERKEVGHEL